MQVYARFDILTFLLRTDNVLLHHYYTGSTSLLASQPRINFSRFSAAIKFSLGVGQLPPPGSGQVFFWSVLYNLYPQSQAERFWLILIKIYDILLPAASDPGIYKHVRTHTNIKFSITTDKKKLYEKKTEQAKIIRFSIIIHRIQQYQSV